MSEYQTIEAKRRGKAVVVSIQEAYLTTAVAAEILENELQQVIARDRPRILVLDFTDVKIISSSTIGKLLIIQNKMREEGGQLHLCCVSIPIAEVYRTLGLSERHLLTYDSVEEALNAGVVEVDDEREIMED